MASENMKVLNARPQLKVNEADAAVFTKPALAVLAAVVALFVAARLWNLASYNLWGDEIFALQAARQDCGGLIRRLIDDAGQAPLFYILLKAWIGVGGESLLWLRLLPVLISVATLLPFFLLCRELKLRAAEIALALLLMAVNGYLIYYSQEIRPYSLLLLMTVCSLWLFIRFFNSGVVNKTHLLSLLAVNTLLVYTHYFGWLVIGGEVLFLCFRKRQRLLPFAVTAALTALFFSPWAYAALIRVRTRPGGVGQTVGWIPRPGWGHLISFFTILNGPVNFPVGRYVGLLLFGCPVLLWAWHVLRRRAEAEDAGRVTTFWLLSLFSFLPVAIAFSVSQVFAQSVWVNRYLIITAVPYLLLVTIAFYRLRPHWVRIVAVLLLVGWVSLAGFKYEGYSARAPWEPLVHRMIQAERSEVKGIVTVYVYRKRSQVLPLRFYLQAANEKRFRVEFVRNIAEMADERFWVAVEESSRMEEPLVNDFVKRGYHIGERFEAGAPGDKVFLFPVWLDEDPPTP